VTPPPAPPELRLPDLPPARHVLVGGHDVAHLDEGPRDAASTVVMVHGNPSWSYHFRHLAAAAAADGHRVLVPDHVGMGRSAKPAPADYPFTYERRVDDFGAFLDAVGAQGPLTLVVHDWGGAIALAWAVRHPARVRRVVLLNTAAFPLPRGMGLPWHLRAARLPVAGPAAVLLGNAFVRGAVRLGVVHRLPRQVRRGYLAPYDSPAHRTAVLRFVQDVPASPAAPAHALLARTERLLPQVLGHLPVLVLWGLADPVLDARVLDRWRELLPGAEVHAYEDAGHFVLEDARELVVPLVLDFLGRT
jgi:haloalkane dehalogenase